MRIGNKNTKNLAHKRNLLEKRVKRLTRKYGKGHAYVHAAEERLKLSSAEAR